MVASISIRIEGDVKGYFASEAAAVFAGSREAIKRQTEETKLAARAVVNAGLTGSKFNRGGNRRAAQTVRSKFYPDTPAGFIYSVFGYFRGGEFIDILAVHEHGAQIVSRRGKMLFIPFVSGARRSKIRRAGLEGEKVDLIPTKTGLLVVTRAGKGKTGLALGILVKSVKIPKRLDFRQVEKQAEVGLEEKMIVEIESASIKLNREQGK